MKGQCNVFARARSMRDISSCSLRGLGEEARERNSAAKLEELTPIHRSESSARVLRQNCYSAAYER